jgi:protein gp37
MGSRSNIEWTEATWNPVTGCSKISPGCSNCYAERMAVRLQAIGQSSYRNGFRLTLHDHLLGLPLEWRAPRMVFVGSMSDLFHKEVPLEFILRVFDVMRRARRHCFQLLTKRSGRLRQLGDKLPWPPNVWAGVSVENADYVVRLQDLRQTRAAVKFVSFEPLLAPVPRVDLQGMDWVIVGGESGPGARPMDPAWVRDIRDQCLAAKVPFFFKQWGGTNKRRTGRVLDGATWDQMPECQVCLQRSLTLAR